MKRLHPLLTLAFAAGSMMLTAAPVSAQTATSGADTPGMTAAPATGQMNPSSGTDANGAGNSTTSKKMSRHHKKHHMTSGGDTSGDATGSMGRPGTPSSHQKNGDGPKGTSNDNGAG